jgi:hypothetical protein
MRSRFEARVRVPARGCVPAARKSHALALEARVRVSAARKPSRACIWARVRVPARGSVSVVREPPRARVWGEGEGRRQRDLTRSRFEARVRVSARGSVSPQENPHTLALEARVRVSVRKPPHARVWGEGEGVGARECVGGEKTPKRVRVLARGSVSVVRQPPCARVWGEGEGRQREETSRARIWARVRVGELKGNVIRRALNLQGRPVCGRSALRFGRVRTSPDAFRTNQHFIEPRTGLMVRSRIFYEP